VIATSSTAWCTDSQLLDGATAGRGTDAGRDESHAEACSQE
jgi:hypothetical protein